LKNYSRWKCSLLFIDELHTLKIGAGAGAEGAK